MIKQLSVIMTESTDPRRNLALESVLMKTVRKDRMILYLWQNDNTVVIGRNQNIRKECNLTNTERDGVTVVRRPSGGGAVYHDLGNQNYTFITDDGNYDIALQTDIICRALSSLGIRVEKSGRNDILCGGRKVSGNAYYHHGGVSYQHGTLLISSDLKKMPLYLSVDPAKLKARGVDSVRSRIMNLREVCPDLTPAMVRSRIIAVCEESYGLRADQDIQIDAGELDRETEHFSSAAWTYGREYSPERIMETRFAWGGIRLEFNVIDGRITDPAVYTDAMDAGLADRLKKALTGAACSGEGMRKALSEDDGSREIRDVREWLGSQEV